MDASIRGPPFPRDPLPFREVSHFTPSFDIIHPPHRKAGGLPNIKTLKGVKACRSLLNDWGGSREASLGHMAKRERRASPHGAVRSEQRRQMAQDDLARRVASIFGLCGVASRSQTHEGYALLAPSGATLRAACGRLSRSAWLSSRLAQPKNRRNATHPNISTGCQVGFGEALFHVAGLELSDDLVDIAFHEAVEVIEG